MKADAAAQAAQDEVALLTARFDVRRAELDAVGQRAHRRDRRAEERAHARGSASGALEQLEQDVKSRADDQHRVARRRRSRSATRRSWRCSARSRSSTAWCSRRRSTASCAVKDNRDATGSMMIWGMALPRVPRGRHASARPRRSPTSSRPADGGARQGRRERSRQPAARARRRRSKSTRLPAQKFTAKVGALSGLASARRLLRDLRRDPPVRRHVPVRQRRTRG